MGRAPVGVTTFDLSGQPFFGQQATLPLDLALMGPATNAPGGYVEVDWLRLVRRPLDGLTVELLDEGEANRVAEVGDRVLFAYHARQPVEGGTVTVRCTLTKDGSPFRFGEAEEHDDLQGLLRKHSP